MSEINYRVDSTSPIVPIDAPIKEESPLPSNFSTIEQSQNPSEVMITSFQVPILESPHLDTTSEIGAWILEREHEIIRGILDSWLNNLAELAEEVKMRLKSPFYQSQKELNKIKKKINPSKMTSSEMQSSELDKKNKVSGPLEQITYIADYLEPIKYWLETLRYKLLEVKSTPSNPISSVQLSLNLKNSEKEAARIPSESNSRPISENLSEKLRESYSEIDKKEGVKNIVSQPMQGIASGLKNKSSINKIKEEIYSLLSLTVGKTTKQGSRPHESIEITYNEKEQKVSHQSIKQEVELFVQPEAVPLINLMMLSMIHQTAWSAVAESHEDKKNDKSIDMRMAEKYAQKIIKELTSPQFLKVPEGAPVNPTMLFYQLVFASSALMLLYSVEAGSITPEEFHGILKGDIKFPKGSLQQILVSLIKNQLQQLSVEQGVAIIEALLKYIDTGPKPEKMMEPLKLFKNVMRDVPDQRVCFNPA
jgi:hypothetical protein